MSARSFRCTIAAGLVLAALAPAAPASASAARLVLDKGCYISEGNTIRETAQITATGFTPFAPINFTLNGNSVGSSTAQADGTTKPRFRIPSIGNNLARFTLRATDGTNTAQATLNATRVRVDIFPRSGRPSTWRTRFSAYGIIPSQRLLGQSVRRTIYAHWLRPNGTVAGTKRIGVASGACGKVVSVRQRAFPFGTNTGTWRVQFDANRTYRRSDSAYVRVALRISRIF